MKVGRHRKAQTLAITDATLSEVAKLAELLVAPVITTVMGKGIIPEEHPLCMGIMGMHGKEPARRALLESDVILAIGTRFSDRTIPHANEIPMTTKIIHLDIDSIEAGKNPRTKVRLVGDAKKGEAAAVRLHGDPGGPGVERVLEELLHDGRRPLDDLAGGDAAGDLG